MLNSARNDRNRRLASKRGLQMESLEDRVTPIAPIVSTLMPMDDAGDVDVASNLMVQFDRDVEVGSGNISIREIGTDTLIESINVTSSQVSLSGDTLTIDPASALPEATPLYVTIDAGAVRSLTTSQDLTSENFNGVNLGPTSSSEAAGLGDGSDFTLTPPTGWSSSFTGANGVNEFNGWSFIDENFWDEFSFINASPGGEGARNEFLADEGTPFAVADAANWGWTLSNQFANPPGTQPPGGTFETTLTTPSLDLSGVEANSLRVTFDSSWVIDGNGTQEATITVSYDGGAEEEVLVWSSDSADANFKATETNETITVLLPNPAGASSAEVSFNFSAEDDDRWWAFDNVQFQGEVVAAPGTGDPFEGLTGFTSWNFATTGIDGDAPQIVSVTPAPGSTGVSLNPQIVIEFDEPVQAGIDGFVDIRLTTDNVLLDDTVLERVDVNSSQVVIDGNTVTVTLDNALPDSTDAYVYLSPGAFLDLSGNFNTTSLLVEDFEGVELVMRDSVLANDGAAGIDLNDYVLLAEGQLDVQQTGPYTFGLTSDDGASLRIFDGSGSIVTQIRSDVLRGIGTVDLSPVANLTAGETYTFEYFYFERGGGSGGEAMYAPGNKTGFDADFRLIGDASQGLGIVGEITATTLVAAGATIDSLADAEALINGSTPQVPPFPQSAAVPVVDFNNTGSSGSFPVDLNVPGTPENTAPEDRPNRDFATLNVAQTEAGELLGWELDTRTTPTNATVSSDDFPYIPFSVLDKNWWINQQGNQNRVLFEDGFNNLMVVDPDAYDDFIDIGNNQLTAEVRTNPIPLDGILENTAEVNFLSSFRNSGGVMRVAFRGEFFDESNNSLGTTTYFTWSSEESRPDLKMTAYSELVELELGNPAGAASVELIFDMEEAGNNWWWAVDDIQVTGAGLVGNPSAAVTDPTTFAFQTRNAPSIVELTPPDETVGVDPDTTLSIEFEEPVFKGTGVIEVRNLSDDQVVEAIDVTSDLVVITDNLVTINRSVTLDDGGYYVSAPETVFVDAQGNPFLGLNDSTTWNFFVGGQPEVTLVFQQGGEITANGNGTGVTYEGTQDADPAGQAPTGVRNRGQLNPDGSDGGAPVHGLTKFEDIIGSGIGQIPEGSTILSSSLQFTISGPGTPLNIHEMLQDWDEDQITWNGLGQSPFNATPGIQGDGVDATAALFTFAAPVSITDLDVTESVQNWADGNSNFGWGFTPTGNDGVDWQSSEAASVDQRPRLVVTFQPPDLSAPEVRNLSPNLPLDGGQNVPVDSNLTIGFNEDIQAGTGDITIRRLADDTAVETISVTSGAVNFEGRTLTIDPSSDLPAATDLYVEISAGAITDEDGNGFDGISAKSVWTFFTEAAEPLTITSLTPTDDSSVSDTSINLEIAFNRPVVAGTGNVSIFQAIDDSLVESIDVTSGQVSINGETVTIDPSSALTAGEEYYVLVDFGAFENANGDTVSTVTPLFQDFEGLTMFDSLLSSDGDDESDFTTLARAQELGELIGWGGSFAPEGGREEFGGFTFLDKNYWIAQQGNQDRDRWNGGTGVVVVADGDAYDDGFGIPNRAGMFFLTTPEIPTTELGDEVNLSFNSSFRPYDVQRATIEVRFDGGEWELLDEFTTENSGGNSAFNRIDDTPSYSSTLPAGTSNVQYRFGYLDFDNDWWWAIDNVQVTGSIGQAGLRDDEGWNFVVEAGTDVPVSTTITSSGVEIAFDRPMDVSVLNLYEDGNLGEADLVLSGPNGDVSGSLIPDGSGQTFQFVATGGVLEAGDYTLTLISGANAFVGTDGEALDGDFDGTPGGDYVETFTVAAISDVVVSIADFARFAGQAVVIPNTGAGLPIRLSDTTGVTELSVEIAYNPAVLTITGAEVAEGLPAGTTVNVDTSTEGLALVTFSSPSALSGTELSIVELVASVPSDAPAAVGQVLTLGNVSINGGSIGGIGDSAVHAAAYFGDVNNDGSINVSDVTETLQVAGGTDAGFAGVALVDPRLVGDINGDGLLTVGDVSILLSAAAGQEVPQIPMVP